MRIIINELKKIFNIKAVVLLTLISIVVYYLFISFDFKYFPNGRPDKDNYRVSVQMLKTYGNSMDEKEFEDFEKLYDNQLLEADKYLQAIPEFKAKGITNYEKFMELGLDSKDEELQKIRNRIIFKDGVDIFWELQVRNNMITHYKGIKDIVNIKSPRLTESQLKRYGEVIKDGSITAILPDFVFENYNRLASGVVILIILNLIFMLSPIYIKDRNNKVNYLQYTSKTGRKMFKCKLSAGLIASFIIITLQLVIFFVLYSGNKVGMFFDSSINSVFNWNLFWYNLTFKQYISLTVVCIYIIGFAVSLLTAYISRIAPNYITLLGIEVPVAFGLLTLASKFLIEYVGSISFPKYLKAAVYFLLFFSALVFMIIKTKKERTADIIN